MTAYQRNSQGFLGLVLGAGIVLSALSFAPRQQAAAVPTTPAMRTPQEFSSVFRAVANEALPSLVSVITTTKSKVNLQSNAIPRGELPPGWENSPFRDFFEQMQQPGRKGTPRKQHGQGSGFIIDAAGIIMTNNHVVEGADEVKVRLQDGREFIATEVKTDPRSDIAIIRIADAKDLKALKLGDSNAAQVGDWVVAIGSPFGLDFTVTQGIISAKGRAPNIAEREDFIQHDAAINPGNSGGPLLNLNGEVIGINTAISSQSGGYDGIGFAVPSHLAEWVGKQLAKHGTVKRAYLGTSIQPLEPEVAKKFKVNVREGALIAEVFAKSPAEKAKVEPGDVVIELNQQKVSDPRSLQAGVEQLEVGKTYPLVVIRNGQKQTLNFTAEEMPADFSMAKLNRKRGGPAADTDELGLEVKTLTPEVASSLKVGDVQGVVVTSITEESPAAKAQVQVGDVILKVGKTAVTNAEEYHAALKEQSLGDGVVLQLKTKKGKRMVMLQESK